MPDRDNLARRVPQPVRERPTPAKAVHRPTPLRPQKIHEAAAAEKTGDRVALAAFLGILIAINLIGWFGLNYYLEPTGVQARSDAHEWLRPSGYIGQSAGIIALLIFAFLWLYPLRKKYRAWQWTGTVGRWLDIHILTALGMPLLLTIHAAWHTTNGLIGLGFWSMMIVVASGVVGRYLYMHIPRTRSGVEMSREDVTTRRQALLEKIAEGLGLDVPEVEKTLSIKAPPVSKSILGSLGQLVTQDIQRTFMRRRLKRRWKAMIRGGSFSFRVNRQKRRVSEKKALEEAVVLAMKEVALEQEARMLDATNRVFQFWHVAHRPFAIAAGIAVIVHVTVVIWMGQTWFGDGKFALSFAAGIIGFLLLFTAVRMKVNKAR